MKQVEKCHVLPIVQVFYTRVFPRVSPTVLLRVLPKVLSRVFQGFHQVIYQGFYQIFKEKCYLVSRLLLLDAPSGSFFGDSFTSSVEVTHLQSIFQIFREMGDENILLRVLTSELSYVGHLESVKFDWFERKLLVL